MPETSDSSPFAPFPALAPAGALRSALAEAPQSDADQAVIGAWLREFDRKPNTQRAYLREARRFWLWLTQERKTTLRALTREDIEAYRGFLRMPPAHWMAGAKDPAASPGRAWAPLRGPLSSAASRQALVVLQVLFTYLVDAGHVRRNVLRLVRDKGPAAQRAHRPVPAESAMLAALQWLRCASNARPRPPARRRSPNAATC
jgi:hypothetical protein